MTTFQKPVGSGFGAASTSDEVIAGIDLSGKIAIVTGGYAGLGLETSKTLAGAGAKVVVPARDRQKAFDSVGGIPGIEIETMDLMDPDSIDAFAERFLASGEPLHILVNNAGIMWAPLMRDSRGYESHFSTNHLGHFQLTRRLWSALEEANGARVIAVSSWGHRFSPIVFEDLNFHHRDYDHLKAYGQSKTANNLFGVSVDQCGKDRGIRAFSLHPGAIVDTDLKRHASGNELLLSGVFDADGKPIRDPERGLKTIAQGAATQIWCAVSPQLDELGGLYAENCDISEVIHPDGINEHKTSDVKRITGVMDYSIDPESAERLWKLSEKLVFG